MLPHNVAGEPSDIGAHPGGLELLDALKEGGLPCTMDELERRFNVFVNNAMRGHDWRTTRLTLDR